jgi:cytochrome P450
LYFEPVYRMTRTYYREKKYRKRCCLYLDQVLKERRQLIAPNNNLTNASSVATMRTDITKDEEMGGGVDAKDERPLIASNSFIDHMVLQSGEFSDEEIHDHIYTFVAAGYETVALQTFFTLLLLAIHTDLQERAFREVAEVGDINCESLNKLPYLDRVVKESMRLLPSVPIVGRETREETEIGDKKVPKGITLLIHLFNLHRRKDIWGDDAEQFNPDRFLPENVAKRHSCSFLPFSEGLRDCIGKVYAMYAIKTVLVTFLRQFRVTTELKLEELTYKADITLKICQDAKLKVEKR